MRAHLRPSRARLQAALLLLGALAGCKEPAQDPCRPYRAYDNVIHDAAEWNAFVASGCTVVQGHLTLLAGSVDPANVPAVQEITGGLGIALVAPSREVALPHLRSIGADLIVTSSADQEAIHLAALTSVGYSVGVSGNGALRVLEVPALASVGGGWIKVLSNASLEVLDLPALATPVALVVDQNSSLASLSFPSLATAFYLSIWNDPALVSVSFPALTEVLGFVDLSDLPVLPAVRFPVLQAVGTESASAGLSLYSLDAVTVIDLPVLRSVARSFDVFGNQALATMTVPVLDVVGDLQIGNNRAYPECLATALRDHLAASCGLQGARIGGNDTTATCGP